MTIDPFELLSLDTPIHEFSLERMLTDRRAFGLTTASPVQRAICRAADGLPLAELATNPDVIAAFGGEQAVASLPLGVRPRMMVVLAAVRGAKSMIAGAAAVRSALSCDVSMLTHGEVPRASVLSVKIDNAQATFGHIRGHIEASPDLSALLVGKPKADSLMLQHHSGRPIEAKVVAGGRAANSLQSRWAATFVADEAPRMLGEDDGVSNLDDAIHAIEPRLLPGAQMFLIGSPWAPLGPVYDLVMERHGLPGPDVVVVRATGPQMNPAWWTPERCEQLRLENPDAHAVDVLCQFKAPGTTLLDAHELLACAILEPGGEPNPRYKYLAVIDPATRGNAWALLILARDDDGCVTVPLVRQWLGSSSRPLSPRAVFGEIADIVRPYGITSVHSDQWSADALRDIAISVQLYLFPHAHTMADKVEQFDSIRAHVTDRKIRMVRDSMLLRDLGSVRKRVTQASIAIDLPLTADGRHCDFAAALALGMAQVLPAPDPKPAEPTERDYAEERKRALAEKVAKMNRRMPVRLPP